jgi:peptidoglycan/LPS O-acetylase OafA/YrhL/CubicO group peptidase (beta-lactamase class C family)
MASSTAVTLGRQEQHDPRLPYLPCLDGLRALAVVAVLLYHADFGVRGGFLGVESFFVLSGFLITALLLAEWRQHGRINVAAFWLRRARRLLPALVFMLAGTLLLAAVLLPGEATGLGGDMVAALGYVMNWHLIFSGQSYFDPFVRPSLLQNLWSLAVEEQFYLIWPLLFIAGMRAIRSSGMVFAIGAAIAASSISMAALYQPGADPSRIYYGTDTRAAGLLLGAALAFVWTPSCTRAPTRVRRSLALDSIGLLALAALTAAFLSWYEYHPLLYRGGFLLVALGTAITIVVATHPGARLVPGVLGWQPLCWIGVRSYAIYLWHWPIFMVTRPYVDVSMDGWQLLLLRLALVLALAELSYRCIEMPVRHGAIERMWRAISVKGNVSYVDRHSETGKHHDRTVGRDGRSHTLRWRRLSFACLSLFLISIGSCTPTNDPPTTAVLATPAAATVEPAVSALALTATSTRTMVPPTQTATTTQTAVPPTETPTATASATSTPQPSPTHVALQPLDPALVAELQNILDKTVADGHIPGAVLAVSMPGYQTWTGASGIANRQTGQPMEPTTHVRIASISKIFTAVVVLQLVEEGRIDLETPLATWLPDLVPNGDSITVRNLLQHTSGLYDYLEDRTFVNRAYREADRTWTPRELVAYAIQFPPAFRPGAEGAWDYSSTNYVLLGMIVEQATGNTLAQEMRQRIFDPLGLEQTFFAPDEAVQGVQAHGYSNTIDQTNAPMSFVFATANLVSTPGDVQRFIQALLADQLLKPETRTLMESFVSGKGQYNMPDLAYGLGLMRNRLRVGPDANGQPRPAAVSTVVGHIGGYGGFRSAVWSAPESGITIALGVNQGATDPNILATEAFAAMLTHQGR